MFIKKLKSISMPVVAVSIIAVGLLTGADKANAMPMDMFTKMKAQNKITVSNTENEAERNKEIEERIDKGQVGLSHLYDDFIRSEYRTDLVDPHEFVVHEKISLHAKSAKNWLMKSVLNDVYAFQIWRKGDVKHPMKTIIVDKHTFYSYDEESIILLYDDKHKVLFDLNERPALFEVVDYNQLNKFSKLYTD